ncbi:MAG TPA: acyl carrier protein [Hyphomonadaceae bacterium]|jgi:acyl carrier protein|nr:acyl carrier protein [Hyphomonadaceae bacterium]
MFKTENQKTTRPGSNQPDAIAAEIAAMLAQILAKPSVKPDDDFFELGGDSLSATELMIAIHGRFGVVMDPVEVFEQPKIRLLARIVADVVSQTP